MAGKTKFIATDARSFLFTRRLDGKQTVYGDAQLEWLKKELAQAAEDSFVQGVVILQSFSWKSQREFATYTTLHEKHELAEFIRKLKFNTEKTKKWLVMVSGDDHMLSYDSGEFNPYGNFPLF